MSRDTFTRLIPKEINFVRGEQPAPSKLNGAFKQIESAFSIIEYFLGNGLDYRVTEDAKRKMLYNLSAVIGRTDRLYKPINKINTLAEVYRLFVAPYSAGTYDALNDILTITAPITIEGNFKSGEKFGIFCAYLEGASSATVSGLTASPQTLQYTQGTTGSYYLWNEFAITQSSTTVTINNYSNTLYIKSIYSAPVTNNQIYNYAYCLPITRNDNGTTIEGNDSYWLVAPPCRWSDPALTAQNEICAAKTCDYCIGNTYAKSGESIGTPACSGAFAADSTTPLTYTLPVGDERNNIYTIQSPLCTVSMPYNVKMRPFRMHDIVANEQIPENSCILYDSENTVSPLRYDVILYSASSTRGDMFYTRNIDNIIPNETKRYIILGGMYGMLDLLYEMMSMYKFNVDSEESNVAVYG